MGKDRAPHLHTESRNRTGWLHFQRWAPLQPGLLLSGMLEEEQPKENNGCFILWEAKGKEEVEAAALVSLAIKEALRHPLTAAMLLRLGTQFLPNRRTQDI